MSRRGSRGWPIRWSSSLLSCLWRAEGEPTVSAGPYIPLIVGTSTTSPKWDLCICSRKKIKNKILNCFSSNFFHPLHNETLYEPSDWQLEMIIYYVKGHWQRTKPHSLVLLCLFLFLFFSFKRHLVDLTGKLHVVWMFTCMHERVSNWGWLRWRNKFSLCKVTSYIWRWTGTRRCKRPISLEQQSVRAQNSQNFLFFYSVNVNKEFQ